MLPCFKHVYVDSVYYDSIVNIVLRTMLLRNTSTPTERVCLIIVVKLVVGEVRCGCWS